MLKKLINDPFDAVDEMVEGFVAAHSDLVRLVGERAVARQPGGGPKVGLVIGGGSGHEPAFLGYVGAGLADAAAVGNTFAAPSPDVCLDAIRAASTGMGVLLSYGNYAGDIMNFGMAAERAAAEGIETRTALVTDDVASAPKAEVERRRGIAGDIVVFKCAGAMAERGATLDEVERVARAAVAASRTMGVAAASTAGMVARIGRASRLGERSRGLPDAGATSLAIIVRAMAGASDRTRSADRG